MNNKLELDAQTELPVGSRNQSVDFPARHKLSARYAVTNGITLVGGYEIAKGDAIDARTARIGFDVKPWTGGRLVASTNRQSTNEYGPRSFAAFGLSQSLPVNDKLTVDFTLDGNKTLGGIDPAHVHSVGMSAGGLQTTAFSFLRASYVARFSPSSRASSCRRPSWQDSATWPFCSGRCCPIRSPR